MLLTCEIRIFSARPHKDKLLELEKLEQDLKDQQKSLYIKHKNLERLENKTNNLYKKQLTLNHDFQELKNENEILAYKARKADNLELENHSLNQEIILLNQKLKKKSKRLDNSLAILDSQNQYINFVAEVVSQNKEFEEFFYNGIDKCFDEYYNKKQQEELELENNNSKSKGMSM